MNEDKLNAELVGTSLYEFGVVRFVIISHKQNLVLQILLADLFVRLKDSSLNNQSWYANTPRSVNK